MPVPTMADWARYLYQYFRLLLFAAHAITSILFLVYAFTTTCTQVVSTSFFETANMPSPPAMMIGPSGLSSPRPTVPGLYFPAVAGPPSQCGDARRFGADVGVGGLYTANRTTSWCYAQLAVPLGFADQQEDVRGFMLGAAWNVLVLILVFEWITASFALIYLQEPAILWRNIPMPPGVHPVPAIATLWNLALIVILWLFRSTLMVPDNNLFLYSLQLVAVIFMQNYLARPGPFPPVGGVPPPPPVLSAGAQVPVVDMGMSSSSSLLTVASYGSGAEGGGKGGRDWNMDTFLHKRSGKGMRGGAAHGYSSGGNSNGAAASVHLDVAAGVNGNLTVMPDVPLHNPEYALILDERGEAVAARMMEYTITAPLLIVGMYLNYTNSALTWNYQLLLVSLCVCNGFGIPLHYIVLLLRSATPSDRVKLQVAGWIALVASWLAFAVGFTVYIDTASYFLTNGSGTGIPSWVVMLLWSVIILYSLFGVVITYFYVPRLWDPTPAPTKPDERDPWFQTFDWVVFFLDILSLSVKLAVAWTVYSKGSVVNCLKPAMC